MEKTKIPLVASEIAHLWNSYMSETMGLCILRYFDATAQDQDTRNVLQPILVTGKQAVETLKNLFQKENIPIPVGYEDHDVNLTAAPLFNDTLILQFVAFMCRTGTDIGSAAASLSARQDVSHYFGQRLRDYAQFENTVFQVLLEKGLFCRAPYIPYPEQVEFAKKKNLLTELMTPARPLEAMEITQLFLNSIRNSLGLYLMTALSQVSDSKEICEYMNKGKELSSKFMGILNEILKKGDVSPSALPNMGVTNSTEAPFSEKLLLNMVVFLNQYAISAYGNFLSFVSRADIVSQVMEILSDTIKYTTEGINLSIKLGYFEVPPTAPDRKQMAKS